MEDKRLRLDVGCGGRGTIWDGFIGIDIWPPPKEPRRPAEQYMQLDFVKGELPWGPGTVDEIVALHVIEHMLRDDGLILMKRARELLKPGCYMTVACPDLKKLCVAYIHENDRFWDHRYKRNNREVWPGDTLADKLNWAIHQEGHRWAYDLDSLRCLAVQAGWGNVQPIPFNSPYHTRKDHETGIVCMRGAA